MNAQEIFDTVATHLFTQGERGGTTVVDSWNTSGTRFRCRYRGDKGLKCAVGALIPDELYDPKMDQGGFRASALVRNGFNVPEFFTPHATLLDSLQTIHDSEDSWLSGEIRLKKVAEYFELSPAILDNLSLPQAAAA